MIQFEEGVGGGGEELMVLIHRNSGGGMLTISPILKSLAISFDHYKNHFIYFTF